MNFNYFFEKQNNAWWTYFDVFLFVLMITAFSIVGLQVLLNEFKIPMKFS